MTVLDGVLAVLALSLVVAAVRAFAGPTAADRVIGADFGFAVFVAGLAVLAARLPEPALLDLVLAVTLVGFLATVAFAHLVERGRR